MIGIIGGMSAESTKLYVDRLNAETRRRLGGLHSADLLVRSVDFADIAVMQSAGQWDEAGAFLADIAVRLERAGADIILLATNTMHKVADRIEDAVSVPFVHIADATGARIAARGLKRPALLATAFTVEESFYTGRLTERFGLEAVIPTADQRALIHRVIYEELCRGIVSEASRAAFVEIARSCVARGADCVILGCTEVGLLLNDDNVPVPVFDTACIHADTALDLALAPALRVAAE